jgi:preprotein translocase subunit YajC
MFASVAYAQEPAAAVTEASPIAGLMPIILMVVLFYFLLIRPQQKKMNEHKKMVAALRRGDKVLTSGGIFGTISKVEDDAIVVEIAPEVKVKVEKNSISTVITRTEPADGSADKGKVKAND